MTILETKTTIAFPFRSGHVWQRFSCNDGTRGFILLIKSDAFLFSRLCRRRRRHVVVHASSVYYHTKQFRLIWDDFFVKSTIWWKTECDENDVLSWYHTDPHDIVINKCSIIRCDLLLMSSFLIMGVLRCFCFPLSWFLCWFAIGPGENYSVWWYGQIILYLGR